MKRKKSPWKNGGSGKKVYRFKKFKEDQSKRLVRRSVSIMKDNQTIKKLERVNNIKSKIRNNGSRKSKATLCDNTLEEGELRSEDDDDDDDCILVEPNIAKIIINDEDDEDVEEVKKVREDKEVKKVDDEIPSTTSVFTTYQSLIKSFNQPSSSTPCNKITNNIVNQELQSASNYIALKNLFADNTREEESSPLFFEDLGGGSNVNTINPPDNYTKLSTIIGDGRIKRRSKRLRGMPSEQIIDLDDSNVSSNATVKSTNNKLKRKFIEIDDSVIFISETNNNDFIPITENNNIPNKKVMIQDNPCTPANKGRLTYLYTKSEKKQLTAYNENTYNPSAGQKLTKGKRMVIIDGSNVAFKHALDKHFSVKGLKIAINYFEKMGHEVKAVIPQFRMNKNKSSDYEALQTLNDAGKIVQTPCKNLPGLVSSSYDDRFILQLAFELDAAIVSNDNYRDLLHENPAFKKIIENCVIGYTWCNDIFILPKDPYGKWGPSLQTILNR